MFDNKSTVYAFEIIFISTMSYLRNHIFFATEATRERIIDEYGTSAVWLGGIPLLGCVEGGTGLCSDTVRISRQPSPGLWRVLEA